MTALEWVLNRGLDIQLAAGEMPPGWMMLVGLALFGVGAAIITAWSVRAFYRRRAERSQPPPGNLLDVQDWLADRTEEIPAPPGPRYRGRRRAPREPRNQRPRQHVVPAHPLRADVVAAQVVGGVSADPDATAVLVRPRGRWSAR